MQKKDSEHRNKAGKISKYFDRNQDTLDALDYDDLKKYQLFQMETMPVMLKKCKYDLSNTCAIDSITQAIVVAVHD